MIHMLKLKIVKQIIFKNVKINVFIERALSHYDAHFLFLLMYLLL